MQNYPLEHWFMVNYEGAEPYGQAALLLVQAWLVIFLFWAYGRAFARLLFGKDLERSVGFPEAFVLGIFISTVFSLTLNFFVPLRGWIGPYWFLGLALGLWQVFEQRKVLFSKSHVRENLLVGGVSILIVLGFCFKAIANSSHPDTGIYHMPAIQWILNEKMPLGSANLITAFAFNSLWSSSVVLLWHPLLKYGSMFVIDTAVVSILVLVLLKHIRKLRISSRPMVGSALALLLFLFYFTGGAQYILFYEASSISNDIPAAAFSVIAFITACVGIRADRMDIKAVQFCIFLAASVLAGLIKMSYLPIGLMMILYLVMYPKVVSTKFSSAVKLPALCIVLCSTLMFGLWFAKAFMMSACLIYPFKATCFLDLPWAISGSSIEWMATKGKAWALDSSWAQARGLTHPDLLKSPIWMIGKLWELVQVRYVYPATFAFLLALPWVLLRLFKTKPSKRDVTWTEAGVLFATSLVVVLIWFFNSPNYRYSYGSLPVLFLTPVAWLLAPYLPKLVAKRYAVNIFLCLAALLMTYQFVWSDMDRESFNNRSIHSWPRVPSHVAKEYGTERTHSKSGQKYFVGNVGLCFDAPGPCAQHELEHLNFSRTADGRFLIENTLP